MKCCNGHEMTPANTYVDPSGRSRCRRCPCERHAAERVSRPRVELTERQVKSMRERVADGVPIRIVGKSFGVGRARVVSECADILKGRAA